MCRWYRSGRIFGGVKRKEDDLVDNGNEFWIDGGKAKITGTESKENEIESEGRN